MLDSTQGQNPHVREDVLSLEADVLVLGGGPAGTWAAWSAASQGARVVLAPQADEQHAIDEDQLGETGLFGSYRAAVGWGAGRSPGARLDQSFRLLPLVNQSPAAGKAGGTR